jgi:hypothetical protein
MIQDDGIVSTGAGTHSPHTLQVTAKSQNRAGGSPNTKPSIGEQKAKCPALSRSAFGTWQEDSNSRIAASLSRNLEDWGFLQCPGALAE